MSVLVKHNNHTTTYNGKTHQNSIRDATPLQGNSGDRQKVNISGDNSTVVVGNRSGGMEVNEMNMIAVQRVDGSVNHLLATVPQVVLYQYEASSNIWERTTTEGTLFIYSRNGYPSHGFVLLNRLSSDNLQEMVEVGSEYRVKDQFVLFKKSSDASGVYGLCFNNTSISSNTGQLLTSLSATANGTATRTVTLASDMRSQSVPSLPHTQGVGSKSGGGEKVNILEMIETAGNSYLNQVFSDDTGSSEQDSPPSETITFTAHPLTTSQRNEQGQSPNVDKTPPMPSARHQKANLEKERSVLKRSTPRTIPKLVNMNATPLSSTKPPSQTNTSSSHHVRSKMQYSTRVVGSSSSQSPSSTNTPTTATNTTHNTHSEMHIARNPLRSSTAPSHMSISSKRNQHGMQPFSSSSQSRQSTAGPLQEVVSSEQPLEPRQLFMPEFLTHQRDNTTESRTGGRLHHIFTQSLPTPLSNGSTGDSTDGGVESSSKVCPIQPMSVEEIEKQMNDEAPSPDRLRPFAMFPLPQKSSQVTNSLFTTLPITTSQSTHITTACTLNTTLTTVTAVSTVNATEGVLRQPSSFLVTPPGRAMTTPLATPVSKSTSSNSSINPLSSSSVVMDMRSMLQRSKTSDSIVLNIEPPSPVVLSSSQPHRGLTSNGDFPDIPPLMHSPGMRAPPASQPPPQDGHDHALTTEDKTSYKGGRGKKVGGGRGGKRLRGGKRSPGRSSSPMQSGESPSPQPATTTLDVTDPMSRSCSVPSNMSPISVVVGSQPTTQPLTLLSPQQFSSDHNTPPQQGRQQQIQPPPGYTALPVQQDRELITYQPPLSKEHFKQALIHLIQTDDDFLTHIHHAYHLSVTRQHQ